MLFSLLALQPDSVPNSAPIFITIDKEPSDIEGLGEVLLGALGITGVIVVAALVCGLIAAGVIYFVRKSQSAADEPPTSF